MKIALIEKNRVEAQPKQEAICPCCSKPVISKCGKQKVWHWAHKNLSDCDNWWEPETEWHRKWKDKFPIEWQERIQYDEQTNEKHIADIFTEHNLVVEFQHSHIDPTERESREKFYKNMVWVVDGTRLQRDYLRFQKKVGEFKITKQKGVYYVEFPNEVFPKNWLESNVPVIFDYCGLAEKERDQFKTTLWCILPQNISGAAIVVGFNKQNFIEIIKSRGQLFVSPTQQAQQAPVRQSQTQIARSGPTHILHKGRWVKRRRL